MMCHHAALCIGIGNANKQGLGSVPIMHLANPTTDEIAQRGSAINARLE